MPVVHFAPAIRKGSHVLIFPYGESGSGKTYSSLLMARGLVGPKGKIFMIDTETGRGLHYADDPDIGGYEYGELTPPYTPERYAEALKDAESAGADVAVVDSLSHEWSDIGGILEIADAQPDNFKGLLKWAAPKARHKRFVKVLLRTRMHVIGCMRAKEKFAEKVETGERGEKKKVIVSTGFVPEQDKRLKFEATIQLFLPNHEPLGVPVVEKCHKALLDAFPPGERITVATGARIRAWVEGAAAKVDHPFESMKREAEDAADNGMVALRDFWQALTREQQGQLKPHMENLKSIAGDADRRHAEEEIDNRRDEPHEGAPQNRPVADDRLDDPFGLPPLSPPKPPVPQRREPAQPARARSPRRTAAE